MEQENIFYKKELYSKDSLGRLKIWTIKVHSNDENASLVYEFGLVDGKKITVSRSITCGKNIGKKNQTSCLEQAKKEAVSLYNKKITQGYYEFSEIKNPEKIPLLNNTQTNFIHPMLAQDFGVRHKDIIYPCLTQPKLDGCRTVFSQGKFYSRNGKIFSNLEEIQKELTFIPEHIILDGEIYIPGVKFEDIVSLIKNEKSRDKIFTSRFKLEFHVFDLYSVKEPELEYENRYKLLENLLEPLNNSRLVKIVFNKNCSDINELELLHKNYLVEGYEGTIIRNKKGLYKPRFRSKDLQKYKNFMDSEFKIVGFKEGTGLDKNCVIWICESENHTTFCVRPKGTLKQRQLWFQEGPKYIGQYLTVKYQELTKENVPRFPVGISIRNYE
jgi:ATP-dependent DNA ligase